MNIPVSPSKFPAIDIDFGTTIASGLWLEAAQLITYIEQSYPIGMLMLVELTQSPVINPPDPSIWKYMDGTPVSNPNSVFNGATFPDLRNLFIRHPVTGESALSYGGADLFTLNHNHTGYTDYANDSGRQNNDDDSNVREQPGIHRHSINPAVLTYQTVPLSHEVQVYMRIV